MYSIIAFGIWGLCVPGNPFEAADHPGRGVLFGIVATIVSICLPSVEAIYNWIDRLRKRNADIKLSEAKKRKADQKNLVGLAGIDGKPADILTEPGRM
jgi:hypothetical protein